MASQICISTVFTAGRLRAEHAGRVQGRKTPGIRVFQPSTQNRENGSCWVEGVGGPSCLAPHTPRGAPDPTWATSWSQSCSVEAGSQGAPPPRHRWTLEEEGWARVQSQPRAQAHACHHPRTACLSPPCYNIRPFSRIQWFPRKQAFVPHLILTVSRGRGRVGRIMPISQMWKPARKDPG